MRLENHTACHCAREGLTWPASRVPTAGGHLRQRQRESPVERRRPSCAVGMTKQKHCLRKRKQKNTANRLLPRARTDSPGPCARRPSKRPSNAGRRGTDSPCPTPIAAHERPSAKGRHSLDGGSTGRGGERGARGEGRRATGGGASERTARSGPAGGQSLPIARRGKVHGRRARPASSSTRSAAQVCGRAGIIVVRIFVVVVVFR